MRHLYPDHHHDLDDPRADDVETFRETHPAPCGKCNGSGTYERCDDYSCPDYSRPDPKPCACSTRVVWCDCPAGVAYAKAQDRYPDVMAAARAAEWRLSVIARTRRPTDEETAEANAAYAAAADAVRKCGGR